ncbi:MAG: LPS export ABC transporter periplasmic protein LptC [Candidatus Omnitrophota bacterium]
MKHLVFLLVFLCLVGIVTVKIFKKNSYSSEKKQIKESASEVPEFTGLSISRYIDREKNFDIKCSKASIQNSRIGFLNIGILKIVKMEDVEIEFFQDKSAVSIIHSDYGTMDLFKKDVLLYGNVKVAAGENQSLMADKIMFSPEKKMLSTQDKFTLINEKGAIEGRGFRGDVKLSKVFYAQEYNNLN